MAAGGLVGDDLITDLVRDRLTAADAAAGFVLDGYPRTASLAAALDTLRPPPSFRVLLIEVPGDAIVRRMSSRRVCDSCGITQSVSPDSAAEREACPYCGGNLVIRPDDHPDTVRETERPRLLVDLLEGSKGDEGSKGLTLLRRRNDGAGSAWRGNDGCLPGKLPLSVNADALRPSTTSRFPSITSPSFDSSSER